MIINDITLSSVMERIYFSLEGARKLLPEVKPLLLKLMRMHEKIAVQEITSVRYEDHFRNMYQVVGEAKERRKTEYEYFEVLHKLLSMGVFVKDPSIGLIDFYSKHEGREIFLC